MPTTLPSALALRMSDPTLKPKDSKPPHKRRRLSPGVTVVHVPPAAATTTTTTPTTSLALKPASCSSCHRLLTMTGTGKSGQSVACARCNAITCTVCSRTCSAAPPSYPPTPVLSYSPTPPTSPTPAASPRRIALSHTNTNTNTNTAASTNTNTSATTAHRRKFQDEEPDEEEAKEKKEAEGWIPGCGRVVCRACCVEIPQSDSTTCYDCYRAPASVLHASRVMADMY